MAEYHNERIQAGGERRPDGRAHYGLGAERQEELERVRVTE
jgi:hypothetical protein